MFNYAAHTVNICNFWISIIYTYSIIKNWEAERKAKKDQQQPIYEIHENDILYGRINFTGSYLQFTIFSYKYTIWFLNLWILNHPEELFAEWMNVYV